MKTMREGMTVADLRRLVGAGEIAPIYLLVGEEALLREEATAAIRTGVLGADDANVGVFNADVVYGDETEAAEILSLCRNLPMFAARRLVVVRDIGALRAKETERLLSYLDAPVETTCLVLTGAKVDGRIKFFQTLKKLAVTVDCGPLEARTLPAWIREQAAALGLRVDEAAREALQQASGGDLGVMRREMEKLAAYLMPKTDVRAEDVEAVRGADTGSTVWDLLTALGRKDRGNALRIMGCVLEAGEYPPQLLGLIAWRWRQLWKAHEQIARRVPEAGVARAIGAPPSQARTIIEQARTFSSSDLERAFEAFRETDSRLKGGSRGSDKLTLERLVLNLCRSAGRTTSPPRPFAPAR